MKTFFLSLLAITLTGYSCSKKSAGTIMTPPQDTTHHTPADTTKNPSDSSIFFAKGADVSWVSEMEAQGIKFYNRQGLQEDIFQVLKDEGINSIRLRAWVHPLDGYNNTDDVVSKAIRAKNAGMKCVALASHHTIDSLQEADLVIDTFENLSFPNVCFQLEETV